MKSDLKNGNLFLKPAPNIAYFAYFMLILESDIYFVFPTQVLYYTNEAERKLKP